MKIQADRYYWNYWLRYVGDIFGDRVLVKDFTGWHTLSGNHLRRWAKEEYTAAEAKEKFPKEYAELEAVL